MNRHCIHYGGWWEGLTFFQKGKKCLIQESEFIGHGYGSREKFWIGESLGTTETQGRLAVESLSPFQGPVPLTLACLLAGPLDSGTEGRWS